MHSIAQAIAARCGATLYPFGLADVPGTMELLVPWTDDQCYIEEASLDPEYFNLPWVKKKYVQRGGLRLVPVKVQVKVGDSFGFEPCVIKVDVEGSEFNVLKGFTKTSKYPRQSRGL